MNKERFIMWVSLCAMPFVSERDARGENSPRFRLNSFDDSVVVAIGTEVDTGTEEDCVLERIPGSARSRNTHVPTINAP